MSRKVILICGNLFFLARLSDQIRALGYEPLPAAGPEEAEGKAAAGETAAILLDLDARGGDALRAVQLLKSSPRTAAIPLVGFGGHQSGRLEAAKAQGCDLTVTNGAVSSRLASILAAARGPRA